jgi:hypothetical protein
MGATSVTGVGPGDAHPGIKGPGNGRNIYVPLLTSHVVAAGRVTLSAGAATVTFPEALAGSEVNYVVHLTSLGTGGETVSAMTDNGDGNFESFAIAGTGTDDIMWSVVSGAVDAT